MTTVAAKILKAWIQITEIGPIIRYKIKAGQPIDQDAGIFAIILLCKI